MYTKDLELIDKKYVHKSKEENLFICAVRKMLPRKIDIDTFETTIASKISQMEYDYLLQFYVPYEGSRIKSCYILRTASIEVKNCIKKSLESNQLNNENWKYLHDLSNSPSYINAEETGCILKDEESEVIETKILSILGLRHLHINDLQRMQIYNILQEFDEIAWQDDLFYSRMYVNTNHPFFFEHPNEHVPGMMVMEAIRQFGVACSHIFMNVPLKGVQFVLSDMKVNFNGYLELNFPIKLEGRLTRKKCSKSGCLSFVDFSTTVYQKNEPLILSNTIGKYLPNELFNILRRNTQNPTEMHRFIPRAGISLKCFLLNRENIKYEAEVINVSQNGLYIRSLDWMMSFKMVGLELITPLGNIVADCNLLWQEEFDDGIYSDFRISYLDESDIKVLTQVLKTFCYVNEERDII